MPILPTKREGVCYGKRPMGSSNCREKMATKTYAVNPILVINVALGIGMAVHRAVGLNERHGRKRAILQVVEDKCFVGSKAPFSLGAWKPSARECLKA